MTVVSDVTNGTLTGAGTQDILRTATGSEKIRVRFQNRNAAARTVQVWVGGVTDEDLIAPKNFSLAQGYMAVVKITLGSGDILRAEASGANVVWTVEMDILT